LKPELVVGNYSHRDEIENSDQPTFLVTAWAWDPLSKRWNCWDDNSAESSLPHRLHFVTQKHHIFYL